MVLQSYQKLALLSEFILNTIITILLCLDQVIVSKTRRCDDKKTIQKILKKYIRLADPGGLKKFEASEGSPCKLLATPSLFVDWVTSLRRSDLQPEKSFQATKNMYFKSIAKRWLQIKKGCNTSGTCWLPKNCQFFYSSLAKSLA